MVSSGDAAALVVLVLTAVGLELFLLWKLGGKRWR
jgi:hypothetical protein